MRAYVGVSGFSYSSWKGKFYPNEAKSEDFLSHYAKRLPSVEVNSSFYAPPGAPVVKSWASRTQADFRFSFKAPRLITHILKLGKGSTEAADKFSKTLELLGPRRGPVLFQLPPYSKADQALLGEFLSGTSEIRERVFEFRHGSWLDRSTFQLLKEHGAGFCIAETEDLEPTFEVTADFAYFRLRRDSYDAKSIDQWTDKIRRTTEGSEGCYVYLRHDDTGENALLAERLSASLQAKER